MKTSQLKLIAIFLTLAIIVSSIPMLVFATEVVDDPQASPETSVEEAGKYKLGDVNGDGKITSLDLLKIFKYVFNPSVYPLTTPEAADVDHDGDVTNADVLVLFKHIYNPTLFPIAPSEEDSTEEPTEEPTETPDDEDIYEIYKSDLVSVMQDMFEGNRMRNETVMFLDYGDVKSLMFYADRIISVTSYDGSVTYDEGTDYKLEDGKIVLLEGSSIPCITSEVYYGSEDSKLQMEHNGEICNVYWGDDRTMTQWQVNVTYTHSDEWDGFKQECYGDVYEDFIGKLSRGEDVTIFFYGDSITRGASSSWLYNYEPYQPSCAMLFTYALADLYDYKVEHVNPGITTSGAATLNVDIADYNADAERGTITYVNTAVGGWEVGHGVNNLQTHVLDFVEQYGCDLFVLAFGMNNGKTGADRFKQRTAEIIDPLVAAKSDLSILLVSSMVSNPDDVNSSKNQIQFEPKLEELAASYMTAGIPCAVAKMGSVSTSILEHKSFNDYSANNINHPNDYFMRVYAQTLLEAVIGYENMAEGEHICADYMDPLATSILVGGGVAKEYYAECGICHTTKLERDISKKVNIRLGFSVGGTVTNGQTLLSQCWTMITGGAEYVEYVIKYDNTSTLTITTDVVRMDSLYTYQPETYQHMGEDRVYARFSDLVIDDWSKVVGQDAEGNTVTVDLTGKDITISAYAVAKADNAVKLLIMSAKAATVEKPIEAECEHTGATYGAWDESLGYYKSNVECTACGEYYDYGCIIGADAANLNMATSGWGTKKATFTDENGVEYSGLQANQGGSNPLDGLFAIVPSGYTGATGQYLVFRYMIPTTNAGNGKFIVRTCTSGSSLSNTSVQLNKTGEWCIAIVDLSKASNYKPAEDGTYTISNSTRLRLYDGFAHGDVIYFDWFKMYDSLDRISADITG